MLAVQSCQVRLGRLTGTPTTVLSCWVCRPLARLMPARPRIALAGQPLRDATSLLDGDHLPSYVVVRQIAPNWLLPGYSVQQPGRCDSNNNSLAKPRPRPLFVSFYPGVCLFGDAPRKYSKSQRALGNELETCPSPVGPPEDLLGAIRAVRAPSHSPLLHASQCN